MTEEAPEQKAAATAQGTPGERTGKGRMIRVFLGSMLLILLVLVGLNTFVLRGCAQQTFLEDAAAYARHVSERQSKLVVLSIYQRLTSYHEREWMIAWAGIGRVDESEGEISVDLSKAAFRLEGNLLTIELPEPQVDHETVGLQFDKSQTRVFWQRLGCPDSAIQELMHESDKALRARLENQLEAIARDEQVMRQARAQAEEILFAFYRQVLGPEVMFSLTWKSSLADEAGFWEE